MMSKQRAVKKALLTRFMTWLVLTRSTQTPKQELTMLLSKSCKSRRLKNLAAINKHFQMLSPVKITKTQEY